MEKMDLVRAGFLKDTRGADMVEYIVLTGAVALVGLAGFSQFGGTVTQKIGQQGDKVDSIDGATR